MLQLNRLYHMDCMEGMAQFPDKYFELAIVDPPYGLKQNSHRAKSRSKLAKTTDWGSYNEAWDQEPPPQEYFDELFRVSKNQVIWGANHFIDRIGKPSPCWIVWDKVSSGGFADCELAWTSFPSAVRKFTYRWNGMLQENMRDKEIRIHPTQKPVALYRWLLNHYAKPGDKILDTHVGSASSLVACHEMGYEFIGFEIDEHYHRQASERLEAVRSQMLFA